MGHLVFCSASCVVHSPPTRCSPRPSHSTILPVLPSSQSKRPASLMKLIAHDTKIDQESLVRLCHGRDGRDAGMIEQRTGSEWSFAKKNSSQARSRSDRPWHVVTLLPKQHRRILKYDLILFAHDAGTELLNGLSVARPEQGPGGQSTVGSARGFWRPFLQRHRKGAIEEDRRAHTLGRRHGRGLHE